jgi:hypothetical protein
MTLNIEYISIAPEWHQECFTTSTILKIKKNTSYNMPKGTSLLVVLVLVVRVQVQTKVEEGGIGKSICRVQ